MSDTNARADEPLPLSGERRVDGACVRFEAAWRTNQRPRIEDHLGDRREPERSLLLRELLRLELDYRRQRGERPALDEYLSRFPQHTPLVSSLFPTGTTRLAGYELLEKLGEGGMGVVYKARNLKLKRVEALKMIHPRGEPSANEVDQFRREAEVMARLHHPHVVQVYDVGEHDGRPYVTMEYAEGGSLAQKLNGVPLPPREAAKLVAPLARAVQAVHDKGVLHRDLKPSNVLLTADSIPKVGDFGLARLEGAESLAPTGAVIGTPSYMAPEQASGEKHHVSAASDTYCLGAVLYECLTGRPPFRGPTAVDTLLQVKTQEPVPPRLLDPKIDRDLQTICLKCLEKVPTARYASAEELARDLERYLEGEPIHARPPSWLDSFARQFSERDAVEPERWGAFILWSAMVHAVAHFLVYGLVQTTQPPSAFWFLWALAISAIWLGSWYFIGFRRVKLTRDERHVIALNIGVTIGEAVVWLAHGAPYDARLWAIYPTWATCYGIKFFAQGSLYSGRSYFLALLWFALALILARGFDEVPSWSPLAFGLLYSVSMTLIGWSLRHRRK
jgi:serine/threonine protein kinase